MVASDWPGKAQIYVGGTATDPLLFGRTTRFLEQCPDGCLASLGGHRATLQPDIYLFLRCQMHLKRGPRCGSHKKCAQPGRPADFFDMYHVFLF